ncbi:MAG: hypothetical protein HZB65_01050 [Candidatus Aenigmarchaeota archaeon]|nr:hypothetical protein [Candidatus Aenigmarchaeota archaeon]
MKLERYEKIIKGRIKARFAKTLRKSTDSGTSAMILNNDNDDALKPLRTARLSFQESVMQYSHLEKQNKGKLWATKQTAKWIENMARERKGIIINPGNIEKNLGHVISALSMVKASTPIILETDGYYSEDIARQLNNIVDVHIMNFKYMSSDCAEFLGKTPDYADYAKKNILAAEKHGDLVLRHQILPSHIECDTKPILEWVKQNLSKYNFQLCAEFTPRIGMENEISRRITISEYNDVMKHARNIGLEI